MQVQQLGNRPYVVSPMHRVVYARWLRLLSDTCQRRDSLKDVWFLPVLKVEYQREENLQLGEMPTVIALKLALEPLCKKNNPVYPIRGATLTQERAIPMP